MTNWQPSDVFAKNPTLRLSLDERAKIQEKLPQAEDGNFYADAVFEGGGVKGTAFLGALRCFDDAGIKFRKVAGTSAGAITAAMLAAGFTVDRLESILGALDYNSLLSKKTSPFIVNGSPEDDLDNSIWMLVNLLLVGKRGQYSSEPFLCWLQNQLDEQGISSFTSIKCESEAWYHQRELRVVVSDISQKAMRVLPLELPAYQKSADQFSVSEAVRLSMSIPLFFEPGKLGESTIVDGGILSNFPLWIYDAPACQRPKCPTFGFQLGEEESDNKESKTENPTRTAAGIFSNMFSTMLVAVDRHYVVRNDQGRVIKIGTGKITATKFNLSNADKDYLYEQGYQKAKDFLLNEWSWEKHLGDRGFCKVEVQESPTVRELVA
uniref:Phospholipase n=1 Tax=Oscillatoriales cyanobacterium SpSt-402 TaxID=2282168 RepID=A0A832H080_9CYAN